MTIHIITAEYPPQIGGVSDYTRRVAEGLAEAGDDVHVWCPASVEAAAESATPTDGAVGRVTLHPDLGRLAWRDLRDAGRQLDRSPAPRRVLVQWVPHGFGWHAMNLPFCWWILRRAREGDRIELMVHEPYLAFGGPLRHWAVAAIHRLMTVLLLRASTRVWIAIPTWEQRLRPYLLGRRVPVAWLPVPSPLAGDRAPDASDAPAAAVRARYAPAGEPLIGHFGALGPDQRRLLRDRLPAVMAHPRRPSLLLLGQGSETFRDELAAAHPDWIRRLHAVGFVPAPALAAHLSACDLLVQPYPDGISSRRTSAMAGLSLARPIVTTRGPLTEAFWAESGALVLADVGSPSAFADAVARLLGDEAERREVSARARALYDARFHLRHTVAALRAA